MTSNSKAQLTLLCLLIFSTFAFAFGEKPALRVKGKPSGRDLLNLSKATQFVQNNVADTLRILAIRAEFVPDTLDVTTGDGKFVLTAPAEPVIDPPPHDKSYFEAQLQALANYYKTVSNDKLILTWQVYPQANDAAYQLPNDMLYYAPDDENLQDQRLAELFRDAFLAADQQDAIAFSQFDSFVLFHAGVGNDVSFDFDPTPNDVASAFLNLNDLAESLADSDPSYRGLAVQNGSFFIQDGIILPETESQEGFEIGLLGTAAIMMGFQLGLPSLFNPDNGASGIGRWGLMDQGSGNFLGLLPAEPSAWEKVFMGWAQPIAITAGENFQIAAPRVGITPNKIYKISISADEYFLLENRQRDINNDQIAVGFDVSGNRVEFNDIDGGSVSANAAIGVVVSVDEYDFGLPGSGILIWHIDEKVIRANLADNRVNADRERRGVDLEEADGAQDIGQSYGFLDAGSGAENGVLEDAWWASNPVITEFLRPGQDVIFGPDTQPSTRANNGANSHIVVYGFSESADIMSFSVRNDLLVAGFPQYTGREALPPIAADLNPALPGLEIVVARKDGTLLVWQAEGASLLPAEQNVTVEAPGMERRQFPLATWLQFETMIDFPPAIADVDLDGAADVLIALSDNRLAAIAGSTLDADGRPMILWQADLPAPATTQISVRASTQSLWIGLANGELLEIALSTGEAIASHSVNSAITQLAQSESLLLFAAGSDLYLRQADRAPQLLRTFSSEIENIAIADLDNDSVFDLIAKTRAGQIAIFTESGESRLLFQPWQTPVTTGMAVGDVDGNGRKDLIFASRDEIRAFHFNGASLLNFPVSFRSAASTTPSHFIEPLLLQSTDETRQTIIAFSGDGDLSAFSRDGVLLDELSLSLANTQQIAGAAADLDGDGELELLSLSGDFLLTAVRLPGVLANRPHAWTAWGGDAQRTRANLQSEVPEISAGELLPTKMAYNYPNPTEGNETTIRYRLNGTARSVSIKIIDLAGDLVDEFAGTVFADADNEIPWRLNNVQSGVYLARIEAQGEGGQSAVALFKIAVVK